MCSPVTGVFLAGTDGGGEGFELSSLREVEGVCGSVHLGSRRKKVLTIPSYCRKKCLRNLNQDNKNLLRFFFPYGMVVLSPQGSPY